MMEKAFITRANNPTHCDVCNKYKQKRSLKVIVRSSTPLTLVIICNQCWSNA